MKLSPTIKVLFIFFLLTKIAHSQNTESVIVSKYTKYFENTRELPYLHLNKTTFLNGEEIWFNAYVIEQNSKKPHNTSSNLYVSIFDNSGSLKEQQLVHVKNGIGYGSIYLDSTYTKNHYFLKASTNWMKNFNEDQAYYQKISIVNTEKSTSTIASKEDYYDFQLFPEGGHLLESTVNNIGILIKDPNNKGVKITKGVVKNLNGNVIQEFSTNSKGMGKTALNIKKSHSYIFEATLSNGTTIEAKTPKANSSGITLRTITSSPGQVYINVVTNSNSLNYLTGKTYTVFIHNTRNYRKHTFTFNKKDETYVVKLNKSDLSPGINIITVLNEMNKPVVERLTFIRPKELLATVGIQNLKSLRDSTSISLQNPNGEKLFLSASVLPPETIAYNPEHNIASSILLKPYINGSIENVQYYFKDADPKRLEHLDLLLLTQGWSKYNWNDIYNRAPGTTFEFENGIDITTTFNKKLSKKERILVYSKKNRIIRELLPGEEHFQFKNSYVKKGSVIDFARKTKDHLFKIAPAISYSNGSLKESVDTTLFPSFKNILLEPSNFKNIPKNIEVLNEVVINASGRKEVKSEVYGAITMLRRIKMEDMVIPSGETVIEFLRFKGYGISSEEEGLRINPRGISHYGNRPIMQASSEGGDDPIPNREASSASTSTSTPPVRVYLDDSEITEALWILESIYLNTIKEIYYGRNHDNRSSEQIHIYSLSPSEYSVKSAEYHSVELPVGFASEKEYYTPKYPSFFDSTFKNYGVLFWKPNITLDANATFNLTIPSHQQEHFRIYIEGITESGKLISYKKDLKANTTH